MSRKLIGIDTGVNTGVSIWNVSEGRFELITSTSILKAFEIIRAHKSYIEMVYVEDARQVKYKTSRYKAQGAGSVKRDCGIWEEFLAMEKIPSTFVRPQKAITKIDAARFKRMTRWEGRTNEHGRDAAMLIYGRKGILTKHR